MERNKHLIFVVCFVIMVSLIGCSSKEVSIKKEDVIVKDTETEYIKVSFSTENVTESNSQMDEYEIATEKTIINSTTEQSESTEHFNTEIISTQTENKKPVENTTTLEPTINNTSTNSSEIQEEPLPVVQEEEVPLAPELSMKAFELINAERVKLGLEPAVWDAECERISLIRAEEIAPFAIPEHDGFFKFQNENRKLCECLAWGYLSEEEVVNAWMNSSAHKDILMDAKYVKLAVARIGNKWVAVNSR